MREAVVGGGKDRLRPVILTTVTTIGGLLPLLFETSMQAQLVQPLAITLVFGMLVSPVLELHWIKLRIQCVISLRLTTKPMGQLLLGISPPTMAVQLDRERRLPGRYLLGGSI